MSHRPVEPRIPSSASRAKPAQRYQLTILLTLAACAVSHPLGPTPNNLASDASIDTLLLRSVASLLADDALGGRRTGTAGARTAAAYLVSECRRLGLEPLSGAGYRQEVPLLAATIVPGRSQIRIVGPGVDTTFAIPADFLADVGNARTLRDFAGELAYVGQAREVLWRRSDLPPLAGRVALMRA